MPIEVEGMHGMQTLHATLISLLRCVLRHTGIEGCLIVILGQISQQGSASRMRPDGFQAAHRYAQILALRLQGLPLCCCSLKLAL